MRSNSIWVVIPTYWGPSKLGIYDHPTPVDGPSTLPLLLDSLVLQKFSKDFKVLILVAATSSEYEEMATARTREIIVPYSNKLDLYLADVSVAQQINQYLASHKLDLKIDEMRGYSSVRNMQLLIPAALGAKTIIALDDDEVVSSNYLARAIKWIGKKQNNNVITGLAGPYLNESGSPFLPETEQETNILLDKSIIMNKAIQQLMAESVNSNSFPVTPLSFGGNMVFDKSLFSQVGFDPAITRGEDIDYVINSRIEDKFFYFDSKLVIKHLPPRQFEEPLYAKLSQDIIRFIYEYKKLKFFNLNPESFKPYPGDLLNDNFPLVAKKALKATANPELVAQFGEPDEIISNAQSHAAKNVSQYANFTKQWPKAIMVLGDQSIYMALELSIRV